MHARLQARVGCTCTTRAGRTADRVPTPLATRILTEGAELFELLLDANAEDVGEGNPPREDGDLSYVRATDLHQVLDRRRPAVIGEEVVDTDPVGADVDAPNRELRRNQPFGDGVDCFVRHLAAGDRASQREANLFLADGRITEVQGLARYHLLFHKDPPTLLRPARSEGTEVMRAGCGTENTAGGHGASPSVPHRDVSR